MRPILPPEVYVKDTGTVKGRGVYALRNFAKDEVIEEAPVLLLDLGHYDLPAALTCYAFSWKGLTGDVSGQAIAMGYGGLYNHSNPANMRYVADSERQSLLFIAVRDIVESEELTINYSGVAGIATSEADSWFDSHQIAPYQGD